jgi:hypothetical protein
MRGGSPATPAAASDGDDLASLDPDTFTDIMARLEEALLSAALAEEAGAWEEEEAASLAALLDTHAPTPPAPPPSVPPPAAVAAGACPICGTGGAHSRPGRGGVACGACGLALSGPAAATPPALAAALSLAEGAHAASGCAAHPHRSLGVRGGRGGGGAALILACGACGWVEAV